MTLQQNAVETSCEIPGVAVPEALLASPQSFGGLRRGGCRVGTFGLSGDRAELRGDEDVPSSMVLPRLVETHVHLDKCHTIDRCHDVGGDLAAASAAQRRDKSLWTRDDLETRMRRGLEELIAAGCGTIRTHIDWDARDPTPPLAWEIATDLAAEVAGQGIVLQPAALVGIDHMADTALAEPVARRIAQDGGVLGGFVLDHPQRLEGIRQMFALADRFGLALDFHVDEGLDPTLDGLDLIAQTAREMRHQGPVLCGHACALAMRPADDVARVADDLAETGIAVAILPTTNLYLQGRGGGTPRQRGVTMVQELAARGVPVVVGTDNVRDAFCPIGVHDPRLSLMIASLAAHLDPPLGDHLPMITTTARQTLGLPPQTVDTAPLDQLVICDTTDVASLLSDRPPLHPLAPHLNGGPSLG